MSRRSQPGGRYLPAALRAAIAAAGWAAVVALAMAPLGCELPEPGAPVAGEPGSVAGAPRIADNVPISKAPVPLPRLERIEERLATRPRNASGATVWSSDCLAVKLTTSMKPSIASAASAVRNQGDKPSSMTLTA